MIYFNINLLYMLFVVYCLKIIVEFVIYARCLYNLPYTPDDLH